MSPHFDLEGCSPVPSSTRISPKKAISLRLTLNRTAVETFFFDIVIFVVKTVTRPILFNILNVETMKF